MDKVKIVSLNVRGIQDEKKRKELFNFLRNQKANIILLQETHLKPSDVLMCDRQWGNKGVYNHGSTNSRGVAIFTNPRISMNIQLVYKDSEGRVIIVEVTIEGKTFIIINVYGPNKDETEFYKKLGEKMIELENSNIILMGDFNLVLDPKQDRIDGKQYQPHSVKILNDITEAFNLVDIWRVRNPDTKFFSWTRKCKIGNKCMSGSRIDFALIEQGLANKVEQAKYEYGYKMDHMMMEIQVKLGTHKRGPGYWKFNNNLLHDHKYVQHTNEIIEEAKVKYKQNTPDIMWSCLVDKVTRWSKEKSISNAKERKRKYNILVKKLSSCEKMVQEGRTDLAQTCREYINEIENYIELQTQGAIFRSKAKYTNEYEKNTKFFFSLEKKNYNKKVMSKVKKNDGTLVNDQEGILREQYQFYQELYKKDEKVCFRLKHKIGSTLTAEQRSMVDEEITMSELDEAVKSFKANKTPGNSGLTAEFYQFFWSRIREVYLKAIIYAKRIGKLHLAARRGVIALIPKKDRDPDFLKNWRPLTMLNLDYKILAKVLANRMKKVLPDIISESRTGFMKNRQISNSLRVTIDISRKNKTVAGYLLSLDFEKCFDMISYDSIFGSLENLGFGREFIEWSKLLFTDFHSCTTNNGHFSEYLSVDRSCHQGCPAAPLYYLCCGEIMAREILSKTSIKGIKINDLENIISQFADDSQFFPDSKESCEEIIKVLNDIEANIRLRVNYEKSSIQRIANAPIFQCSKPLQWDPGGAMVLGVDITSTATEKYQNIMSKVEASLASWKHRNLSLMGKVLVINSLVASLFVYTLQIEIGPDRQVIKKYNQMLHDFLWGKKKAKIPIELLQCDKDKGGLKLCNLEYKNLAIKATWLFRTDKYCKTQIQTMIPGNLGTIFLEANLEGADVEKIINATEANDFWKETARTWFKIKEVWIKENFPCTLLWYNSKIKINGEVIYLDKAANKGINFLTDIVKEGKIIPFPNLMKKFPQAMNWLEYESLKSAIPKKLLQSEKTSSSLWETILKNQNKSKCLYNILLKAQIIPINKKYVQIKTKVNVTEHKFQKAFKDIQKISNITKFRDFQYRLLVNGIHTNDRLFYWKIVPSQICEYCKDKIQNIEHLMYSCDIVRKIWREFQEYIDKEKLCMDPNVVEINWKTIFLNKVHPKATHLINFLTLIIKQHIYACKCLNVEIKFLEIVKKFKSLQRIELYNAKCNNRIEAHNKKWQIAFKTQSNENENSLQDIREFVMEYIQIR